MKRSLKLLSLGVITLAITGCGEGIEYTNKDSIQGVLVVPKTTTSLAPRRTQSRVASECENIPNGYKPLINAALSYIDEENNEIATSVETDICGVFHANINTGSSKVIFTSPSYRKILANVQQFKVKSNNKYTIASTIPLTSSYVISGFRLLNNASVSFTVEDNVTKKAVIGLPSSAFTITENNISKVFSSVSYNSLLSTNVNTETVLTIDASGSMNLEITDSSGSTISDQYGKTVTRRDLTALASYDFITNLPSSDQLAINIFDGSIYFYDDSYLDDMNLSDSNNFSVDLNYANNGFESDRSKSEFVIDILNSNSSLHGGGGKSSVFDYSGTYPSYGGLTNIYDALYTSVEKLKDLNTLNNKYVVLMTDGNNTGSTHDMNTTINFARTNNVVVNTIGFIGAANSVLENIATQTGGSFYEASGLNIADAFSAAQSAINYSYNGVYNTSTTSGDAVNLTLHMNYSSLNVNKVLNVTK